MCGLVVHDEINNLPWLDGFLGADSKDPNVLLIVGREVLVEGVTIEGLVPGRTCCGSSCCIQRKIQGWQEEERGDKDQWCGFLDQGRVFPSDWLSMEVFPVAHGSSAEVESQGYGWSEWYTQLSHSSK